MASGATVQNRKTHLDALDGPRLEVGNYGLGQLLEPDFSAKASDLFIASTAVSRIGLLQLSPSSPVKEDIQYISTSEQLQVILDQQLSPGHILLLVSRRNSWSPLGITVDMFRRIYTSNSITPHFLKLLSGFQKRWKSSDEDFVASYSSFSSNIQNLCYNIRHFEKHGRALEDPWSCRQSIIHQKYHFGEKSSLWLVISPPLLFSERLVETGAIYTAHPMAPHLQYLSAALGCWREYLNYLSEQLGTLNKDISMSMPYSKYNIGFSSINRIHHLRKKMLHAQSILSNTSETVVTIRVHEQTASRQFEVPSYTRAEFKAELKNITNDLRNFRTTIQKLLALSLDSRSMHNDIISFQKQELGLSDSMKLTQIAEADSAESQTMASIAKITHNDSRKVRVMTMVALLYLPLNLVLHNPRMVRS
ncbi:unnamed protein product [Fusarium venenatum]|uniref:CorA-like transporter domain-containing protein n=1 Tax=Fusarium venenatum TaxID=56646 RepID=A0A2L2SUB0_9HYPO|nr:uncharacterized protein FVRRES_04364 [Fusarium venenatum]CEI59928.1 unnamed protein product [Fusarium venenatum]